MTEQHDTFFLENSLTLKLELFSKFIWVVVFENTLGDKNMFNVDDQEDTRTASVNVIQMFL